MTSNAAEQCILTGKVDPRVMIVSGLASFGCSEYSRIKSLNVTPKSLAAISAKAQGTGAYGFGKSGASGFEDGLGALSKPSSKALRQNMINTGAEVPNFSNAAHHIVAGSSPKAAEARAILKKYGVNINDAVNGTFLPTAKDVSERAYHLSLHTNAYYNEINKQLLKATSKEDVLSILDDITEQLLDGTFMK